METSSSHLQSILFDTKYFDEPLAIKWIHDNNFKIRKPPDIKKKHIRIRQEDPDYKNYYYRTKHINPGVEFIIGYPILKGSGLTYNDATKAVNIIKNKFNKISIKLEPVGSYLRRSNNINDLDFITSSKLPNNKKYIKETISYNGVPLQIDIWSYLKPNKLFAKFARSGTKRFNIVSRRLAKLKGFKLTDKGLFDNSGKKIHIKNEKDLFKAIGMRYKSPINRV